MGCGDIVVAALYVVLCGELSLRPLGVGQGIAGSHGASSSGIEFRSLFPSHSGECLARQCFVICHVSGASTDGLTEVSACLAHTSPCHKAPRGYNDSIYRKLLLLG